MRVGYAMFLCTSQNQLESHWRLIKMEIKHCGMGNMWLLHQWCIWCALLCLLQEKACFSNFPLERKNYSSQCSFFIPCNSDQDETRQRCCLFDFEGSPKHLDSLKRHMGCTQGPVQYWLVLHILSITRRARSLWNFLFLCHTGCQSFETHEVWICLLK